jgi:lysophospholipid acyltransferase (LPLAT)-like uncharacterized protein
MIKHILPMLSIWHAKSLRVKWSGATIAPRSVIVFWHDTMFAGWWSVRKRCPIAMVSQSKDGAILAMVLEKWGYKLVRGSSSTGGMEALEEAIDALEQSRADTLVITPDGPRGPRHEFKRGAFLAAKQLDVPLYFLRIKCKPAIILKKSWDKFAVPMPFSSVMIEVCPIDMRTWPEEKAEQFAGIQNASKRFQD